MGYTTDFHGEISVFPPMSEELGTFLTKFNETRRVNRKKGPDYVGDEITDIINNNLPPEGQPGLWCGWRPDDYGTAIEWDGMEKFYHSAEWMKYIIDRYLTPRGHVCNGEIDAQGEDAEDRWRIVVKDNVVFTQDAEFQFLTLEEV